MPAVHHAASATKRVMRSPTPMRSQSATDSPVCHVPVRSPRSATMATTAIWSATAETTTSAARRSGPGESFGVTRYQWPRSIAPSEPPRAIATGKGGYESERCGQRANVDEAHQLQEPRRRATTAVDEPHEERPADSELGQHHREDDRERGERH